MKRLTKPETLRQICQGILWTIFLLIPFYVAFCYLTGSFNSNEQLAITAVILTSMIIGLYLRVDLTFLLAIITGIAHIAILVTWGNIVPYIQLLPFLTSYLLLSTKKSSLIAPYLAVAPMLTILELLGIIPIISSPYLEMGPANLIILLALQIVTFVIGVTVLKLYSTIDNINTLGLSNLTSSTSRNFLIGTFAKGLYISMLFHFLNNFLNSLIWGEQMSKTRIRIFKLFAESDRQGVRKIYTIEKILKLIGIKYCADKQSNVIDHSFGPNEAKILYLLIYNIYSNYQKYSQEVFLNAAQAVDGTWTFIFAAPIEPEVIKHDLWTRNLGTMKQFLQLTNKGTLDIQVGEKFTTIFSYVTESSPLTLNDNQY